ncbi:MAG: imidazole glycerol phosphate synthase subunit HisH [Gammaproteobacteria bacterium]|nr:imidazole glycerol phosphate synthase subunit HisH [Gammaproteobacteria bacterium]
MRHLATHHQGSVVNVAIVDNGGANMNSLVFALQRLGVTPSLCSDIDALDAASHIILPGVGHARDSMHRLQKYALDDYIRDTKKPVLGICLGMQLFYHHSEEGATPCLDLVPGTVRKLVATERSPVPHMGWNQIHFRHVHPLLDNIETNSYMYFVHSYAAPVNEWTTGATQYEQDLSAITIRDNFMGVQFHPERSGDNGAILLSNFLKIS